MEVINFNNLVEDMQVRSVVSGITFAHNKSFGTKYKNYHMLRWIDKYVKSNKEKILVCVSESKIIGYCTMFEVKKSLATSRYDRYSSTDTYTFISNLCSIKKGGGSLLLKEIIKLNKNDLMLSITKDNLVRYYERFGFKRCYPYKKVMVRKEVLCS